MNSLEGRRALVTGASSGIGRATAVALARCGAKVLATGRNGDALNALAQEAKLQTLAGDLNDASFVERLAREAGDVDLLVNNAGSLVYAPLLETTIDECRDMFETNVIATLRLTQAIARTMVARKAGHILMVSSVGAREVYRLGGVYCATKHAISALARALRLELQGNGIRVSEIAPGGVDTNIRRSTTHPAAQAAFSSPPFTRLRPEEVAQAVVFAASAPPNCCADLIELRPLGAARI